jgi:CHAD domain-containing protein
MKARRVKKLEPSAPLVDNAARIVRVRLRELRSFTEKALEPKGRRARHDMRIAAKRLRYVLEMLGFCLGPAAKPAQHGARELQQLLGEIHDCDVMLPRVGTELDRLRKADVRALRESSGPASDLDPKLAARAPSRASYRGLETLAVYLRARRELLFDRFVELWQQQESAGTWNELKRAVDEHLERLKQQRQREAEQRRAAEERRRADLAATNGEADLPAPGGARTGGSRGVNSPLDPHVR